VLASLVPEPGSTLLAKEYRSLVRALGKDGSHGSFDHAAYDPRSVREAEVRWRRRMVDEYASTTVFSGLVADLVEANASLDASVVVLRMAQDEFRHAEICGRVVKAMGGANVELRETTVRPLARHDGVSTEERALRNVLVTSISEMYSVAFFVASLETMTDPFLRAVTRDLLADEVLHGRFGFQYLEAWAGWLAGRPEVRASIARYLRYVFAVCEKEFVPGRLPRAGDDDDALGLVTSETSREVFEETMAKAVAPGLDRFDLAASDAWRRRSLKT
jgi:hypothetical protein